ncbi:EAL domain-containing protein [uncultured Sulfuricurvum sp.]|uniref:bifunctional diguanylate cyclase/phosphodiesterase n=1 Tax=Sulfuricurvum sp. TaxID=2025608 RepID=UPI00262E0229|nr:EAL domain-containing protein [uncultured Sulfuricurvum sp.]
MKEENEGFSCSIEDTVIEPEPLNTSRYGEILTLQNKILELMALGVDEIDVLHRLCEMEEKLVPGAVASIMILDEATGLMNVLEAPSIPPEGIAMLNGLRPGPGGGSCGNVLYRKEAQFVTDIENDPRWDELRPIAKAFGLGACWSMPVRSEGNTIIGTFALSSFTKRSPSAFDKSLLEIGAFIVGILLQRREHQQQIQAHEKRIRILGTAFENSREGIMLSDENNNILEVNQAFIKTFGYTHTEVIGKNPKMLSSGRHDPFFYEQMWKAINEEGRWSGEIKNRRKDGTGIVQWMSISVVDDYQNGTKNYLAVTLDISQLKESEEKLSYMAYHDPLTGLANRTKLFERIDQFIQRSKRSHAIGALLYLDLDRFKNLNDSMGHTVGDQILVEVAARLSSRVRSHDLIARVGGDEFVLWLEDLQNTAEAEIVAEKFLNVFNEPFIVNAHEYMVQGSIGIALYPQDARQRDSLLKNGDAAMYRAKEDPKRKIAYYRLQMTQQAKTSLRLESELYQALKNYEFELYYQPKIDAMSGVIKGAEALIRWNHPTRGLVMPGDFISFAEQTSLISQMGEYVLEQAFEQLKIWQSRSQSRINVSVNLSGRQLNDDDIASLLGIIGKYTDLAPFITIELTETFLMHHAQSAVSMLEKLKNAGVMLSIDDFGTGYSSLGYLKRFKVDELKIDRLLINDIETDPNDRIIADAVIAMAHTLGLKVVAEGVETVVQAEILRESGCDLFQGFYFDRPLKAEVFYERYLEGKV